MTHLLFIKRIRLSSFLSFILPLIAINLCWILYFYFGKLEVYRDISWTNSVTIVSHKEFYSKKKSLINCPVYKYTTTYKLTNGEQYAHSVENAKRYNITKYSKDFKGIRLKEFVFNHTDEKNSECIKNYPFINLLFTNFNLEELFLKIRGYNKSGFAKIRNPYFYGDVSISRTARYFPANLIFKPFVILSSFFLLIYWLNNLRFFKWLKENRNLQHISKSFFYFGLLSCLFLILHSIFLGIEFESKFYKLFRKSVIILFILFEVLAQIYLTINIVKLSKQLKDYIRPIVLKIKIGFVFIVAISTIISFYVLIFENPTTNFKHMLEWNYFSFLLIYYILSNRLWKLRKP